MDVISLPMISRSASVSDAIDILTVNPKGGLILEGTRDQYTLLWTGKLLESRAHGIRKLAGIEEVEGVHLTTDKDAKLHKIDVIRPLRTTSQYSEFFKTLNCDYSILGAGRNLAFIATRSEQFAWALGSIGGYQCNGPSPHFFPQPRVNAGDTCPLCPNPLSGGKTATVRPSF